MLSGRISIIAVSLALLGATAVGISASSVLHQASLNQHSHSSEKHPSMLGQVHQAAEHPEEIEEWLAENRITIEIKGDSRVIESNGIPDHSTGTFPNRGNPNSIREQNYKFNVPVNPKVAERVTILRHQPFGVAINGVVFDPGTAEFWNGDQRWNYEALSGKINLGVDLNKAHVQPNGAYHYHGVPTGLMNRLDGTHKMTLLGYAADGFPIYGPFCYSDPMDSSSSLVEMKPSYRVRQGKRPEDPEGPGGTFDGTFTGDYEFVKDLRDLDECNGRYGVTPEYPKGTYYYVVTYAFPSIPRYFKGTPDSSFERRGGPTGRPRRGGPPPPKAR